MNAAALCIGKHFRWAHASQQQKPFGTLSIMAWWVGSRLKPHALMPCIEHMFTISLHQRICITAKGFVSARTTVSGNETAWVTNTPALLQRACSGPWRT